MKDTHQTSTRTALRKLLEARFRRGSKQWTFVELLVDANNNSLNTEIIANQTWPDSTRNRGACLRAMMKELSRKLHPDCEIERFKGPDGNSLLKLVLIARAAKAVAGEADYRDSPTERAYRTIVSGNKFELVGYHVFCGNQSYDSPLQIKLSEFHRKWLPEAALFKEYSDSVWRNALKDGYGSPNVRLWRVRAVILGTSSNGLQSGKRRAPLIADIEVQHTDYRQVRACEMLIKDTGEAARRIKECLRKAVPSPSREAPPWANPLCVEVLARTRDKMLVVRRRTEQGSAGFRYWPSVFGYVDRVLDVARVVPYSPSPWETAFREGCNLLGFGLHQDRIVWRGIGVDESDGTYSLLGTVDLDIDSSDLREHLIDVGLSESRSTSKLPSDICSRQGFVDTFDTITSSSKGGEVCDFLKRNLATVSKSLIAIIGLSLGELEEVPESGIAALYLRQP